MRFRNIDNWENLSENAGLLYFAQRLEELTFSYTLDSFKAPTTNAPFLVLEFLDALEAHKSIGLPLDSALHILDEAERRLRGNTVVTELLTISLDRYLKADRNNVHEMESSFRVLSKEILPNKYLNKCIDLLKESCVKNKKSDIEFLCKELSTTLLNIGSSSFHLNTMTFRFFFGDRKIPSSSVLDDFFGEIYPIVHNFDVLIKSKTPISIIREDILEMFDISFSERIPEKFITEEGHTISHLENNEHYVIAANIEAIDRFSAAIEAKEKISRIHDLFGIFHHKGDYYVDEVALAIQKCCADETHSVKTQVNRMHFIDDNVPEEAEKKLNDMIENLRIPSGQDRDKFFRIINFHGMSSKSDSMENQLINLWTSLETIAPTQNNKSIISGTVYGILPIIGLRYFHRIFKSLTLDIVRWNRKEAWRTLKKVKAPEGSDLVQKVFCLIVCKDNETLLSDFLGRLLNFELLKYRIYTLNKEFSSGESALEKLDKHQKRVEWQLHRIYRTRNQIVHSGTTPEFTKFLVTNAHDYFDQVYDTSVKLCSSGYGFDNFLDCFNYTGKLFDQLQDKIKKIDEISINDANLFLWKA